MESWSVTSFPPSPLFLRRKRATKEKAGRYLCWWGSPVDVHPQQSRQRLWVFLRSSSRNYVGNDRLPGKYQAEGWPVSCPKRETIFYIRIWLLEAVELCLSWDPLSLHSLVSCGIVWKHLVKDTTSMDQPCRICLLIGRLGHQPREWGQGTGCRLLPGCCPCPFVWVDILIRVPTTSKERKWLGQMHRNRIRWGE